MVLIIGFDLHKRLLAFQAFVLLPASKYVYALAANQLLASGLADRLICTHNWIDDDTRAKGAFKVFLVCITIRMKL